MSEMTKICAKCGLDCSHGRRVWDPRGRYFCGRCFDAMKAAHTLPKPPPPEIPPDQIIPLADDAPPPGADAAVYRPRDIRTCSGCGKSIAADLIICPHCRYNITTGRGRPGHDLDRERPCAACGYDLRGLPHDTPCPECGSRQDVTPSFREKTALSHEARQAAYVPPLACAGVGLLLIVVFAIVAKDPQALVVNLFAIAAMIPIGIAAYWVYSRLWEDGGIDEPIHIVAMRLAGVFAVVFGVAAAGSAIPGGVIAAAALRWLLPLIVTALMIQYLFDMDDISDAAVLALFLYGGAILTLLVLGLAVARLATLI